MTPSFRKTVAIVAGLILAGSCCLAADSKPSVRKTPPPPASRDFYTKFLMPRMNQEIADERGGIDAALARPEPNPWLRDTGMSRRLANDTLGAAKGAVKRYLIERLNVDAWSLPLMGRDRSPDGATSVEPGHGARVRFGVSHLTPRAEVVVPLTSGRFAFSADARGRMGASFESRTAGVRLGASFDPVAHDAGFGLTARF
jgi:hypothetical protein